MPKTHQLNFTSAFAIWAALGFFAALYGTWLGQGGRPFAVTLAVLVLFLAVQIFLAARNVTESLLARLGRRSALAVALFPFAAYLFYAVTAIPFDWKWVAFGTVYVLVPALFVFLARDSAPGNWKDYAAVLAIWLPVELRWLYVLWPYPPLLTHTLTILLALNVGLAAFLLIRRLDGVGYQVEWGRGFGWAVGFHLLGFAAIAIPLGLAMSPRSHACAAFRLRHSAFFYSPRGPRSSFSAACCKTYCRARCATLLQGCWPLR